MLDEESVKAYKSIRLKRDLKPDILARYAQTPTAKPKFLPGKILRPLGALCSLVLITAILIASAQNRPGLFASGMRLSPSPCTAEVQSVTYTDTRIRAYTLDPEENTELTADHCIPLRVKLSEDASVTISAGTLLIPDETGKLICAETSGGIRSGDTFYWSLTGCETLSPLTAHFTDADNMSLGSITLTYVNTDNTWLISGKLSDN